MSHEDDGEVGVLLSDILCDVMDVLHGAVPPVAVGEVAEVVGACDGMSVSEVVMADGQDAPLGEVLREPFVPQKVFAHSVRNLEHESRFATLRAVSRDPVLPVR